MVRFLAGLLFYLFPIEVVAKLLVVLLRKIASLTPTDLDDKLVDILERRVGIKKEPEDERVE